MAGCGSSDPGTPESWGLEGTNTVVIAEVTPGSTSIDLCDAMDVPAFANITTRTVNEDLPQNTLVLSGYSVDFIPSTQGAPPIEALEARQTRELPAMDLELQFIDIGRKSRFDSDTSSGAYNPSEEFPAYTARYTFRGSDLYGTEFGFVAEAGFRIGRYSGCTLKVAPAEISVAGLGNPDGNEADDITFYIFGGSGPYGVVSDRVDVIPHPGGLLPGDRSFKVDPQAVTAAQVITLTVYDSRGATAISKVTVTP